MKLWINVYRPFAGSCGHVYSTRKMADQMANSNRIACKEIDVEAGEGLSNSPRSIPSTETNHGNSSDRS